MSGLSKGAWAGLILLALLCYFQFPGHIFLESDTQIYLPMFERFRDLSLFARDPMVVRAHTAFTLYDEVAVRLASWTGLEFEAVLGVLHMFVRVMLVTGIFLLTRAMGLSDLLALACAGIYALGGRVAGPSVLLVEYEPVPRAFALAPVLLGVGLAARRRYMLAGAAGAVAFLMHPTTAAPFWIVFAALLFVPDEPEEMKVRLRALIPLGVAVVLLKFAAAMQPGVTEPQAFMTRVDEAWEKLIRLRASYVYVSMWPSIYFWQYGLMLVVSAVAYLRLRRFIQPILRFFIVGLSLLGVASLPLSYLLLEKLRWGMLPQAQPLRTILFLELFTILLALVMAFELGCREKQWAAAGCWTALAFAVGIHPRLLFFLAPLALAWVIPGRLRLTAWGAAGAAVILRPFGVTLWAGPALRELVLALALGGLLAAAAAIWLVRPKLGAAAVCAVVVGAFFLTPGGARFHWSGSPKNPDLDDLSRWARADTEINAVFLFADAGRGLEPGVFRARSARALYVDWKGGGQINFFREFSTIWWTRWQQAMADPFAPNRLPHYASLGIDYIVVGVKNRIPGRTAAFENARYVAYRIEAELSVTASYRGVRRGVGSPARKPAF